MKEEKQYEDPDLKTIKTIIKVVLLIVLVLTLLIGFFSTLYIIPAGSRGVLLTFGKADMTAKEEGLHFKIPFVQGIVKMSVQTLKYEADLTSASKDLQDVKTKIAINYRIVPELTPEIYKTLSTSYADRIIYPLEQETNKAVTSQYTAEELITKREEVKSKMQSMLADKLVARGIIIEEVSIINFEFSPVFTQAIEQKVVAEQNALTAKNKLAQIEYEAQQRIAQAEGEARAISIQVMAINQQGGANYVELQRIQKWNGQYPYIMAGSVAPIVDLRSTALPSPQVNPTNSSK